MTSISGFTFIHNALEGGFPIVEAINSVLPFVDDLLIVDMQSSDGTYQFLIDSGLNVISAPWDCRGGETLKYAHSLHTQCKGDLIVHFEADEIWDTRLLKAVCVAIDNGVRNIKVWRIQVEQNFQRIRWNPEGVHRVFEKGKAIKEGHTTQEALNRNIFTLPPSQGFLWDCTNVFRDTWFNRVNLQAELRQTEPQYLMVPLHITHPSIITKEEAIERLKEPHWEWSHTPLDIPPILRPLVGVTDYSPMRILYDKN